MTAPTILVATRNPGKLTELRPLLAGAGVDGVDLAMVGMPELPEEDAIECFETFEENAVAKARYFFERSNGMVTVAEDSGLEVVGLGGRPGVRTKRWSGRSDLRGIALDQANNAALLAALGPEADRAARYVCVVAYTDGASVRTYRGETAGHILHAARGAGGFGYDPLFESAELGMTFAEATLEDKARVSHRGRAFRKFMTDFTRPR